MMSSVFYSVYLGEFTDKLQMMSQLQLEHKGEYQVLTTWHHFFLLTMLTLFSLIGQSLFVP